MPMMDHANEDKNKTLNWENMLHEEKKHFSNSLPMANPPSTTTSAVVASKVSPIWTKDDVASLRKGIVSVDWFLIMTGLCNLLNTFIKGSPQSKLEQGC